jgi:hypothetical protein
MTKEKSIPQSSGLVASSITVEKSIETRESSQEVSHLLEASYL